MELHHRSDLELVQLHRDEHVEAAREALIMRHGALVRAIARRYAGRGFTFDDIAQSGYLGLIQAVDRFDPSRGVPLRGYATRMIEGEIMHMFRDRGWAVRVPRALQDLSRKLTTLGEDLAQQLGRDPTVEELAEAAGEPVELVEEARIAARAYSADSLSAQEDDSPQAGRSDLARLLSDAEPGFDVVDDREAIGEAMRRLPHREREILRLRFINELTQSEIAAELGISQMHVSRLLRSALTKLEEPLESAYAVA